LAGVAPAGDASRGAYLPHILPHPPGIVGPERRRLRTGTYTGTAYGDRRMAAVSETFLETAPERRSPGTWRLVRTESLQNSW